MGIKRVLLDKFEYDEDDLLDSTGSYGDVYYGRDYLAPQNYVAIKVQRLGVPNALQHLDREISAGNLLHSRPSTDSLGPSKPRPVFVCAARFPGTLPDGRRFFVMPLAVGGSLERVYQKEARLGLGEVVRLAACGAAALRTTESRDLVHRDVKCGNFLINDKGWFLLSDYGSALLPGSGESAPRSPVGTPEYSSPEQIRGAADLDVRADIWSLGVVLYRALTGALPFEGDTPHDIWNAVLRGSHRPVTDLRPETPRLLAEVVQRCLVKDPNSRYQRPSQILTDLARLERELIDSVAARAIQDGAEGLSPSERLTDPDEPFVHVSTGRLPIRPAEPSFSSGATAQAADKRPVFLDETVLDVLFESPGGEDAGRAQRLLRAILAAGAKHGGSEVPISSEGGVRKVYHCLMSKVRRDFTDEEARLPDDERDPDWDVPWEHLNDRRQVKFARMSKRDQAGPFRQFLEPLAIAPANGEELSYLLRELTDCMTSIDAAFVAAQAIAARASKIYTLRPELSGPDAAECVKQHSNGQTTMAFLG